VSERLPRLTAREIVRVLEHRGFTLSRSSGSHHIYKDSTGRRVTVSVHPGKILHPKLLQSILEDMDITPDELKKELGR
jgi:predicted RNA binding protein YcfA (HicA-like mRNA interferase family)